MRAPDPDPDPNLAPDPLPGDRDRGRRATRPSAAGVLVLVSGLLHSAVGLCALVATGVLAAAALGLVLLHTHPDQGEVVTASWKHTTIRQTWSDTKVREWSKDVTLRPGRQPVEGRGEESGWSLVEGSCDEEWYSTHRYQCGSHLSCSGSGKSRRCHTVSDYCNRPVYKTKCDYTVQVWVDVEQRTNVGVLTPDEVLFSPDAGLFVGGETPWPAVEVGPLDRLRYESEYRVVSRYRESEGDQTTDCTPDDVPAHLYPVAWETARKSELEFRKYPVGAAVVVSVNELGYVRSVRKELKEHE